MSRTIAVFLSCVALWLLLSGVYKGMVLTLGLLSCLLVAWLAHRMQVVDVEGHPVEWLRRCFGYWGWLIVEMTRSNIDVARVIVSPGLPISPRIVRVRADQRTDLGRTVFANSITLTPGTLSMAWEGDTVVVHALTRDTAEGVLGGEMNRRVRALEDAAAPAAAGG